MRFASFYPTGVQGKKTKVGDDIELPEFLPQPYKSLPPPNCSTELRVEGAAWFAEKVTSYGGAAGKGPDQLPPTAPPEDNTGESSLIADEIDAEVENKTKMAFAKMPVPTELRGKYLLSEADFALNENADGEDANSVDPNAPVAGSRLEDMPVGSSSPKSPVAQRQNSPAGADSPSSTGAPPGSAPAGGKASRQASAARDRAGTAEEDNENSKGARRSPGRGNRPFGRQASSEAGNNTADPALLSPSSKQQKRPRSRQTREKDAITMSEKANQLGLYA